MHQNFPRLIALPQPAITTHPPTRPHPCPFFPLPICSVRMQKLEALKAARAEGAKRAAEEVDAVAAAAATAITEPEVQRPVIQLPKKRRVRGPCRLSCTLARGALGAGTCRASVAGLLPAAKAGASSIAQPGGRALPTQLGRSMDGGAFSAHRGSARQSPHACLRCSRLSFKIKMPSLALAIPLSLRSRTQ